MLLLFGLNKYVEKKLSRKGAKKKTLAVFASLREMKNNLLEVPYYKTSIIDQALQSPHHG
jgi:hypothetical protein